MTKIEDYAAANKMCLNPDKTQVMLISKNTEINKNFQLELGGKTVKHSQEIKVLGITIHDTLMWDKHVISNLVPQLNNRVITFSKLSKYLDQKFQTIYSNSIYRSKLLYGIENWGGGAQLTTIRKLQKIQDKMVNLTAGKSIKHLTTRQKQRKLEWLPIRQEIAAASYKMTYRIINSGIPEELCS